ncbi:hypothetical protein NQ315_008896 [Exocentrus adspersus]|uniref:Uncharacterized protein n=1 Tax=Exocentrus adspersus TaxID=1586481 RepID=A0AAV8V9V0_9CUCU|nr:hypothetical protein NQ315_008896 [Exocentrus adspersus]
MIAHAQYIVKEIETLYMLKKYRTLKRRYYRDHIKINRKYMELFKSFKWRLFCDDTDLLTAHARQNETSAVTSVARLEGF